MAETGAAWHGATPESLTAPVPTRQDSPIVRNRTTFSGHPLAIEPGKKYCDAPSLALRWLRSFALLRSENNGDIYLQVIKYPDLFSRENAFPQNRFASSNNVGNKQDYGEVLDRS